MPLIPVNPFAIAKVFLSHRCNRHRYSRFLLGALERSGVPVWYSCRGDMKLGDPVLPRKELANSDFVLVLASPGSFDAPTVASAEFSVSEILNIRGALGIGIVALEDMDIPAELSAFRFERFRWSHRNADVRRIVSAVKARLQRDLGLLTSASSDGQPLLIAGSDLEPIFTFLQDGAQKRLPLPLNAPMRHFEMTAIVEILRAWPRKQREAALQRLQDIYCDTREGSEAARQNAVFVLGKLASNDEAVLDDLRHRYPDHSSAFLFRGYHLAHAYGRDSRVIEEYSQQLQTETTAEWRRQRQVNRSFHLLYYGGLPGALHELRTTLREGRPRTLLSLNAFTLGELSTSKADVDLLNDMRSRLQHLGVASTTIENASRSIRRSAAR